MQARMVTMTSRYPPSFCQDCILGPVPCSLLVIGWLHTSYSDYSWLCIFIFLGSYIWPCQVHIGSTQFFCSLLLYQQTVPDLKNSQSLEDAYSSLSFKFGPKIFVLLFSLWGQCCWCWCWWCLCWCWWCWCWCWWCWCWCWYPNKGDSAQGTLIKYATCSTWYAEMINFEHDQNLIFHQKYSEHSDIRQFYHRLFEIFNYTNMDSHQV